MCAEHASWPLPGSADAAIMACFVLAFAGYPEQAVTQGERAMTVNPNYPACYLGILGNAYRLSGRIEGAIVAFRAFSAYRAGFGLFDLVIAYQQTDRAEEANRTAAELLSIRRNFTIAARADTQFRADTERFEADIAALRAAGLPMN